MNEFLTVIFSVVVPIVLVAFVAFFGTKARIEWANCLFKQTFDKKRKIATPPSAARNDEKHL